MLEKPTYLNSGEGQTRPGYPLETAFGGQQESPGRRIRRSYQSALRHHAQAHGLARFSWATWLITLGTCAIWCFTAYQVAIAAGARTAHDILMNALANSQDANVLITYGAKWNPAIQAGEYWRFITPIFLHANLLHIGLNMLNFFVLGLVIERIFGHMRFLLIYLVTGVISVIASFYFMPQEVSVGASGAIFGLVGAYSAFILLHRRAFRRGGIPTLAWLVIIIGLNLSIGLVIPNVDNYAHVSGFISGCILGWFLSPFYVVTIKKAQTQLTDIHSLARRWPLALGAIGMTLLLAILAVHFTGG